MERTRPSSRRPAGLLPGLARVLIALGLVLMLVASASSASAHAYLERSDPAANEVLPTAPDRVSMWFTERLERSITGAELYDREGNVVPGTSVQFDEQNRRALTLILPAGLPNGTYSVVWRTLSADDGHQARGYFAFTIGTEADVQIVIPPATVEVGGPPEWLRTLSRWIPLLGLSVAVAVWPVWLTVLRPAISPAWQAGPALTRRVKRLAAIGIAVALLGSVFALAIQAAGTDDGGRLVGAIWSTLTETRYGRVWQLRVGLILVFAVALAGCAWWWPRRRRHLAAATILLAAALPVPFSLISHAAAQRQGRAAAVAFDVAHLLAASVWIGGLVVLTAGLLPTLRDLTPAGRRVVLARAIPRFSAIALAAWAVMGLTGLYAAWLHVGNLGGLRTTTYGRALSAKVLLLIPILALAGFNLLVVSRRLRRGRDDERGAVWSRRFAAAVGAETVLVVVVLLVVGRLIGQVPAREVLEQEAGRLSVALEASGRTATLSVTPGVAGPNHYRLDVGGEVLPEQTEAVVRLEAPIAEQVRKELKLDRVGGNSFEGHGSELSLAGDWDVEVIVRKIGEFQWSAQATLSIGVTPPSASLPGPPWRFGSIGVAGLVLIAAGVAGIVLAWYAGRTPLRKESAGLGMAALALGAVLLLQARVDEAEATVDLLARNPIPADEASIVRGEQIFLANCAACHGQTGRGDGPLATSLNPPYPPPADFLTGHARAHFDGEFFNWIKHGKPPTAMPAFGDQLTDEEIWHVINYIRWLQRADVLGDDLSVSEATPEAGAVSAEESPQGARE